MKAPSSSLFALFSFVLGGWAMPLIAEDEADTSAHAAEEAAAPADEAEASEAAQAQPRPRPRVQFDPGQERIGGEELLRQYLTTREGASPNRASGDETPPEWLVFELDPFEVTDGDDLANRARSTRELLADAWNRLSPEARARIAAEERLDAADRKFFNRFILPWGISPEQRALAEEERMRRATWRASYRQLAEGLDGDLGDEVRAELMLDEYLRETPGLR